MRAPPHPVALWPQLTARTGDFFFGGSTLTLSVEPGSQDTGFPEAGFLTNGDLTNSAAVPAPAPLLLLGVGVAALAWFRRAGVSSHRR